MIGVVTLSKKDKLMKAIEDDELKIIEIQERIKKNKEKLDALNTIELKMMANTIEANGLNALEILQAVRDNDLEKIAQLMHPTNNEQQERPAENFSA